MKNVKMSPACTPLWPGVRRSTLCILLLSGLCSSFRHYLLSDEPKTWPEARQYCREKYTDLAVVENMEDVQRLIAAAGNGFEGKVWIGLHDNPSKWYWSLSDGHFYGHGEENFRRWNEGEPNDIRRNGHVCVAVRNGVWLDDVCGSARPFVCYNRTRTDLAPTSAERYFFINDRKRWVDAQAHCRKHHTDLASVRNETENERIQNEVPVDELVWIGLNRLSWWWWSDRTHTSFDFWADGHPLNIHKSCAASVINATGEWVEERCNKQLHFMCHNKKTQLFHIKLAARKSTIDLNDPAVTEAILNLMEARMKEKGFVRDFRISWIENPDKKIFHKEEEDSDP